MDEAARENGYLAGTRAFDEDAAGWLPRERTVIICTGSLRAAGRAVAHRRRGSSRVELEDGDTVIFPRASFPATIAIGKLQTIWSGADRNHHLARPSRARFPATRRATN